MSYDKWFPNRVHMIGDVPYLFNKNDRRISFWDAQQDFNKAFHTMQTHGHRMFILGASQSVLLQGGGSILGFRVAEYSPRELALEQLGDSLENVEDWCAMMRQALDAELEKGNKSERIAKLRAKAASTTFPGEAASYLAKADELEKRG